MSRDVTYDDVLVVMQQFAAPDSGGPEAVELAEVFGVVSGHVKSQLDRNDEFDLGWEFYLLGCLAIHQEESSEFGHTTAFGEWTSSLWAFTRTVKAYPDVSGLTAAAALRKVEKAMAAWPIDPDTDLGLSRGERVAARWTEWVSMDAEDGRIEFLTNWPKVRYLPGRTPLENALEWAEREPLTPDEDQVTFATDGYRRFLSMAGWLQVVVGDENIRLPNRLVAQTLGVNAKTASSYTQAARADGYIRMMAEHQFNKNGRNRAAEYRFNVELFPPLAEAAQGESS